MLTSSPARLYAHLSISMAAMRRATLRPLSALIVAVGFLSLQGLVSSASNCPSWARQVLCEPSLLGQEPAQVTLPFRSRRLPQSCPLTCQVCDGAPASLDSLSLRQQEKYLHPCWDLETPATQDVWKPGDMNEMYQRILAQSLYNTTVLSRDPWLIQLEDFLTPEQAHGMVHQTRRQVVHGMAQEGLDPENEEGGLCHSTQAWCYNDGCLQQPAIQSVADKVEQLVGMPWKYAEPIHFIEYSPGQKYGRHSDYIMEEAESMQGPRLFTLLMYLSNIVGDDEGGGETCFDDVGVCIHPKQGSAVLWANVLNDQPWAKDNRTWHEANPIERGYKYASTVWYHLRDYAHAEYLGCIYAGDEDEYEEEEEEEDGWDKDEEDYFDEFYD